ncbi:MAG: hypothetical protein ACRDTD_27660 [Pseudonocardiaceae bacterium]
MSGPDPAASYGAFEGELASALDGVLAGELMAGGIGVERRVVESLGALTWLVGVHRVDGRGRCRVCRRGIWRRRSVCTVYRALFLYVRVSCGPVPTAVGAGADCGGVAS